MSNRHVQAPTVLTADLVASTPSHPLGNLVGVTHRVLWAVADSMAGVLHIEGGQRLGSHSHRVNEHHLWVVEGSATICDTRVGAGSYVHVPVGVEHDIDARQTDGCSVFYLYVPPSG
jgi:quercetin dioxygenase-like cupin family protein